MSDEKEKEVTEDDHDCAHCSGCCEPDGDAPKKPATEAEAEADESETEENK